LKRLRKIKFKYFIILIFILIIYGYLSGNINTYSRYYSQVTANVVGYGTAKYTITFYTNGGIINSEQIESYYPTELPISLLEPTKSGSTFLGWYDNSSFTGDPVTSISVSGNYTFYAKWYEADVVAEMNGAYYTTMQDAINHVTSGQTTTIKLLKNISISTALSVASGKDIIFDFQNYEISNAGSINIIQNSGTIAISNGTIRTSAAQGAINNNTGGILNISGGSIINTSSRQAIYNDGGTTTISGTAYLSSTATERGTVHNKSGTMTITGGTIISTKFHGVDNAGTLVIGVKDGNVSTTAPSIEGAVYGVNSTKNFKFYDGVVKGKTAAFNDEGKITDEETGYGVFSETQNIDGVNYKVAYLGTDGVKIRFDANNGTSSETVRSVKRGSTIGTLPTATRSGYIFDWWYTEGGQEVDEDTIVTEDVTYIAHWIEESELVTARVGETNYNTLQAAIDAVPKDKTQTTVTLLRTISENVKVEANQNIIFDFQNYTIRYVNEKNKAVIENNGTIVISNGTIRTTSIDTAAINNTSNLTINGGQVIATGDRQAIYNNGGTTTISGTVYLSATASERATVQNQANSTMLITGGTIVSSSYSGVDNRGRLTIGVKDGNIDTTTPTIRGRTYGVENTNIFMVYDGKICGRNAAIHGGYLETETGYTIGETNETIDGNLYKVATFDEIVLAQNEPEELDSNDADELDSNEPEESDSNESNGEPEQDSNESNEPDPNEVEE